MAMYFKCGATNTYFILNITLNLGTGELFTSVVFFFRGSKLWRSLIIPPDAVRQKCISTIFRQQREF